MKPVLSLSAILLMSISAAAGEFTVGFGETDITPELGKKTVFLAGFGHNRKATEVHDPIMVRAVVMADGDDKIALVTVDVVGLFLETVQAIRDELPGFKYVLVSATHNHEGPDTMGLWGATPFTSGVDPEYMKKLIAGCVNAVKAADKNRQPAVVDVGRARDPDLLHDSRLPIVKHDELVILHFRAPRTGQSRGMLVQWNNHPEALDSKNTQITADFPYYVVKYLRQSHQCPVAYFTGTVGGLMTTLGLPVKDKDGQELADGTFAKADRYGFLVAQLAEKALKNAVRITLTPFDIRTREILIPVENKNFQLGFQIGVLKRKMYVWDGNPVPAKWLETKDIKQPVAVKTEVGYLKLGDLEVAAIPGEIYPENVLGQVQDPVDPGADFPDAPIEPAIYAQLKSPHRMLIGLANDELGYFIPKRQWDVKEPFCYGLKKAQYGEINSVGPEAAPVICNTFKQLVEKK
ncbi:MAG: neutral/alkaline non-lysosomal ceramidase N-terminal domain-containing protein [Gemmata sp.]|nr:neutral/alkaline non-lysosomal ceramidase N-terminal domain-containing protein [Gemmata sp.]